MSSLVFLHLSDLHLRANNSHDLDADLRNELERDLKRILPEVGGLNGILITGDIAFSGKASEYDVARDWLDSLCAQCDLDRDAVWVVPGNHDSDRSVVRNDSLLSDMRKQFRPKRPISLHDSDSVYQKYLKGSYAAVATNPLNAYNKFAAAYGCESTLKQLAWRSEFGLGDGYRLRLYGLNSAIFSDEDDSDGNDRLFVGSMQTTVSREPGVVNVVLCHHPPEWIIGQQDVRRNLQRASLQLFGHQHDLDHITVGDSWRVYAGALHPTRPNNWLPRYNLVRATRSGCQLTFEISFRQYSKTASCFVGDTTMRHEVDLDSPESSPEQASKSPESSSEQSTVTTCADAPANPSRKQQFRVHRLPFVTLLQVALDFGAIAEDDDQLTSLMIAKLILRRAVDEETRARLDDLLDEAEDE